MTVGYSQLTHCGSKHASSVHWLPSNDKQFKVQILHVGQCRVCHKALHAWFGIYLNGDRSPLHMLKPKDADQWVARLERNADTHGAIVSDYTRRISQNTASVYQRVLAKH
jgi:hypothetical protein